MGVGMPLGEPDQQRRDAEFSGNGYRAADKQVAANQQKRKAGKKGDNKHGKNEGFGFGRPAAVARGLVVSGTGRTSRSSYASSCGGLQGGSDYSPCGLNFV